MKLIAKWDNGTQREFDGLDELNVIINKAELKRFCKERNISQPKFEVINEDKEV